MKTILLIRHAKSSWDSHTLNDFDRPLNDRGKKDAPEMAKRLKEKGVKIDILISSPAKRAKKTALFFAKEYLFTEDDIIYKPELYAAPEETFYNVIECLSDEANNITVFSHNPGITLFANSLTDARIDNMPTCSIFAIKTEAKSWKEFRFAKKNFWFFDYPKAVGY